MEEHFKLWAEYLANGIEACAALIITLAALQAVFRFLLIYFGFHPRMPHLPHPDAGKAEPGAEGHPVYLSEENVRIALGRWLALALEFELAADILLTAVAPTWNEIGKLAAIIILRTLLNYFLQKEIEKAAEAERKGHHRMAPMSNASPEP